MKLPEPLEKLHEMRHAKWIGFTLAVVASILFAYAVMFIGDPFVGLYALMIGIVVIVAGLLYLFGWRDTKQMVAAGLGIIILVGMVRGPMIAHYDYSLPEPDPVSSAAIVHWFTKDVTELNRTDFSVGGITYASNVAVYETGGVKYALDNGTLDNYKGPEGGRFNFTITLYSNGTFAQPPEVMVAYAPAVMANVEMPSMIELDPTDNYYGDGKVFYYDAVIDQAGVYSHVFSVNFGHGQESHSLNTTIELGPIVGKESSIMGLYALAGIPSMFCSSGLMFIIIILLFWWLATAKKKRMAWDMELLEKENDLKKDLDADPEDDARPFTCDQCGASVGVDDNFCPKCGERFDDGEELDNVREADETEHAEVMETGDETESEETGEKVSE